MSLKEVIVCRLLTLKVVDAGKVARIVIQSVYELGISVMKLEALFFLREGRNNVVIVGLDDLVVALQIQAV